MKAQICGVDVNIRVFDYIFGAYLGELILGRGDNLSKFLQNPNLPAVDGWCTASATVEIIRKVLEVMRVYICFGKSINTCQEIECERAKPSHTELPT